MIPVPLEAVIFDMDGLLLDTERLFRSVIFSACADLGRQMEDHVHLSLIGSPKEVNDARLQRHFGGDFDIEAYHAACSRRWEEMCGAIVPLRPGARELLIFLTERAVPMGVATSSRRQNAEQSLKAAGIFEFFDVVVTRSEVNQGKPHPETFLVAAAALRAKASNCLALEDSHNGVRAAASAGMATIMIPDMLEPNAEIQSLCAGVLPSLANVQSLLERT